MDQPTGHVWPADVDGDVFRRLDAAGFDFSKEAGIDFNIDFDDWPPAPEFIRSLRTRFDDVKVYEPDECDGYVQITLLARLTYELAMSTQASITKLALPFGGVCESWGVWQD